MSFRLITKGEKRKRKETIPSEQQTVRALTEWANMSLTALVFWKDLWHGVLLSAGRITAIRSPPK